MAQHVRAALGPAGRIALVELIEQGQTFRQAAACRTSRRRPRTGGGGASRWPHQQSSLGAAGRRTQLAPAALTDANAGRAGDAGLRGQGAPTSVPADWRGSSVIHARRSGRSSSATGSPAVPAASARRSAATNGASPARCCTWTSSAWRASTSPVIGRRAAPSSTRPGVPAGSICTSSSTTTAATSTSSSTPARTPRPTRARSSAPWRTSPSSASRRRGGDDRQRQGLRLAPLPRRPARDRRDPHHHPALHAALERQGRARDPHPPRRMGLRAPLGELPTAHAGAEIIRPLLQPQAATQQPRRPATHQPRSQRP